MSIQGPSVDPVTLKPIDPGSDRDGRKAAKEAREHKALETKARELDLLFGEGAERWIALVETRLAQRINELVEQDPGASELQKLLKEAGRKIDAGRKAVAWLHEKQFPKEDA